MGRNVDSALRIRIDRLVRGLGQGRFWGGATFHSPPTHPRYLTCYFLVASVDFWVYNDIQNDHESHRT